MGEGRWGEQPEKVGDQFIQPGCVAQAPNRRAPRPASALLRRRVPPLSTFWAPASLRRADWRHAPLQGRVGSLAVGRSLGGRGCWGEALRVHCAGDKTGDRNSSVLTSFATQRIHANGPNPSTVTTHSALVATASTRCSCIVHIRADPRLLVLDLLPTSFDTSTHPCLVPC